MKETVPHFGGCCEDLRQAMHPGKNSMFSMDKGMLLLNTAIAPMSNATGWLMKPVSYCPFCGTELQSAHAIQTWVDRL